MKRIAIAGYIGPLVGSQRLFDDLSKRKIGYVPSFINNQQMKIVNHTTPQDNKVVTAEQRQITPSVLTNQIKPHPGHRLYEFDLSTGLIEEAVYKSVTAEVIPQQALPEGYKRVMGDTGTKITKTVERKPNCLYASALNKKNALKRFIPMYEQLKKAGQIRQVEVPEVATKIWNHTREDGEQVFIDWEIGDVIDKHDSGCADVALTGEDEQGRKYTADGFTMSGELEEVSNVEEV